MKTCLRVLFVVVLIAIVASAQEPAVAYLQERVF